MKHSRHGFGERIKAARVSRSLSQRQLGEMIGRSQSTIDNWEHENNEPSIMYLQLISRVTGMSAGWLAFGPEQNEVA